MENEYGTVDFNITPEQSTHPVLAKLYERIAELETSNAELEKTSNELRESNQSLNTRYYEIYANFNNYKYKLENVLRTYAQDNSDSAELLVELADEMGIELNNSKDFTVNVSFSITVNAPFGEEIELSEYDIETTLNDVGFEFELNSTDVVYISED